MGIWTNGEVMAICMRTGRNELTFSHTRPWTDPEALLVVAALSFAAVHSHVGGVDMQYIIDELCPVETRRTPAQEGIV